MRRSSISFFLLIALWMMSSVALGQSTEPTDTPTENAPPAYAPDEKADATEEDVADEEEDSEDDEDELTSESLLDELTEEMAKNDELHPGQSIIKERSYPYVEHNGYFRFRGDFFYRPDLGVLAQDLDGFIANPYPVGLYPPVHMNQVNSADDAANKSQVESDDAESESIAGANIRFRYSPVFHVADWLRIHSTVDVLDNLVLGSTPDYAPFRPDAPMVLFSGTQAPPTAGQNAFTDSIRVKEAYAEIASIIGNIRLGRMASHWGLGILANGGHHIDSDYGDYVDRALLTTRIYGVYVAAMWDFVAEGVLASEANQYFGQPYDADQLDDVMQTALALFQRPMTREEKEERNRDLYELHKPVFDWGVYTVFRSQDYDIGAEHQPTYAPTVFDENGVTIPNSVDGSIYYDDFRLVKRGGWGLIPDAWFRLQWSPSYGQFLRIEGEFAYILGEVDKVADDWEADYEEQRRTINQWGAALQMEYQFDGNLSIFLDAGAASGDSARYFGVKDQVNFGPTAGGESVANKDITNFKFDRNFYVDQMLFREAIGAVTNAVYIKPGVQYDLFDSVEDSLGARLDVIVGMPLEAEALPNPDATWYGVEFDMTLFYEERNRFRADIVWGTLLPGDAFNLPAGWDGAGAAAAKADDFAMTVQGRFFLMF